MQNILKSFVENTAITDLMPIWKPEITHPSMNSAVLPLQVTVIFQGILQAQNSMISYMSDCFQQNHL